MKRLLTLIFVLFFVLAGTALALDKKGFLVSEGDGTPSNTPVYKVIYPDGSTSITGSVLTLTLEASVAGTNIFYVGKHGNDSNSGLTRNLAKLTFGAAISAASSGDVIIGFDAGTYTENLTGASGIDIYAPNATIVGAHTLTTGNDWKFDTATVLTDTIGFTMNTASQEAHIELDHMDIAAYTGSLTAGILSLNGALFADIEHMTVGANSYGIGSTTTDEVYLDFGEIVLAEGATAFGIANSGDINAVGACVEDGSNSGTLVYSTDVASSVHMVIAKVDLTILSNIGTTPDVSLVVADLAGSLTESGAGTIYRGGADILAIKSYTIKGTPYGMDAAGNLRALTPFTSSISGGLGPAYSGYDADAAGSALTDEYTGGMGWQMMVVTEGSEQSDWWVTHLGSDTAGTERRHIWWDAGYQLLYFGVMTHSDSPEDVSGLEVFYFDFNYDTNIIGVLPKADASTVGMRFDGLWLDATVLVHSDSDNTQAVTGMSGYYFNGDDDAVEFDLPPAATGKQFCFDAYLYARVVTIDPDGNDIIVLGGVAESAGEAIVSSGAVDESICLIGLSDAIWVAKAGVGTWDGAVD